ncbi:TadE/TadG family type IV pilus assembly protein [Hazenella coriacea]|uniref:TadE-like protein n=1 Tax=Hazenella coriacea TaxID=1179467 RepID=A0A4R3L7Q7_9BACL|nr:TadE/TadG family type IV pilus assembly protein [Hazenella coriacea]TCS94254.1 hypothetical protein EDD58_104123 [Hazenella coriacea]
MEGYLVRWGQQIRRRRKGSPTMEFIVLIPCVLFMCMVIWQFVITGIAVMEAQSLVKEGARLAEASGKYAAEESRGRRAFGIYNNYYKLVSYRVQKKSGEGQVVATADVEIKILFDVAKPIRYKTSAKVPIYDY